MKSISIPGFWQRFLGLTVLLVLTAACGGKEAPEEARVRVEGGPPAVQDIDVTLRYPIELEAAEKVAVSPVAVSGFLTSVLVDVGDKVRAGQVIAMVDCREYAAQRTQAETAISRWQAQEEETRAQLGRLLAMDQNKLVAPAELDRARAAHRVSEAQLADARAKLSEATQRQGYCWLKSPFDGYVSERNLDPGAMVGPGGQPVVTIVKTRDVKVVASVTEQDAPKVTRGAEVHVLLHALPDSPLRGTVARLGRSLDPKTRTLTVEVDVPNAQEVLLPGMTGRAEIVVGKRENALLLPVTAVLNLEEASYVYVVREKDGKPRAHRVQVKLGVDRGDWLEILEGISPTDQVILVGRELVTEGTWVEVTPPKKAPTEEDEARKDASVSSLVGEKEGSDAEEAGAAGDDGKGTAEKATPAQATGSGPTNVAPAKNETPQAASPPPAPAPKPQTKAAQAAPAAPKVQAQKSQAQKSQVKNSEPPSSAPTPAAPPTTPPKTEPAQAPSAPAASAPAPTAPATVTPPAGSATP